MDLRLHPCSVAPAEGHEKCRPNRLTPAGSSCNNALEGLRGDESIPTLCRKEGLAPNLCYRWSKEFLEAGKRRLVGNTTREATSSEVVDLRQENGRLKQLVAETVLENRLLKKSVTASAWEEDERCD